MARVRQPLRRVALPRAVRCARAPVGAVVNTALYDHSPDVVQAFAARGDELIAHGHTNAERQGSLTEADERALIAHCRARMEHAHGVAPAGWLSPWISESVHTPGLLQEAGFSYTLNWCLDDQPTRMMTRGGSIWAVPYPQVLNDIPMIMGRQMDASAFAQMVRAVERSARAVSSALRSAHRAETGRPCAPARSRCTSPRRPASRAPAAGWRG